MSLQGIRAIAFLGIFLYHCELIETGPWGVSIFLILSGFLMSYNYYNFFILLFDASNNNLVFAFDNR